MDFYSLLDLNKKKLIKFWLLFNDYCLANFLFFMISIFFYS
jgi:hypothetical protein